MIDLHCHYLPDVDDGAKDLREALALLRAARRDGATRVVLTPHVFAGRWDNTLADLQPRFDAFARLVEGRRMGVELFLGAEVHLLPESLDLIDGGRVPYIGGWEGSKVVLLEMHDGRIPPFAVEAIRHLASRDIVAMIAHPERNRAVIANPDVLEPFVAEGCLLQLTAGSIVGAFGQPARNAAIALLDRGWVTVVASDAHNLRHRPPMLRPARQELKLRYGRDVAIALLEERPGEIVSARADAPPLLQPLVSDR